MSSFPIITPPRTGAQYCDDGVSPSVRLFTNFLAQAKRLMFCGCFYNYIFADFCQTNYLNSYQPIFTKFAGLVELWLQSLNSRDLAMAINLLLTESTQFFRHANIRNCKR